MTARSAAAIGVLGAGYMGLATGLAFAHRGWRVVAFDTNPRVLTALREGRSPYREAGLNELLRSETSRRRFKPVSTIDELVGEAAAIFVCLPTPRGPGGRIDLRPMRSGLRSLGGAIRKARGYRLVVIKSTVVPGTTASVLAPLLRRIAGRSAASLGVAVNPEFLAEGTMVRDALTPERVVIGADDPRAARRLRAIFRPFRVPILELPPSGAELVKYASNAFLATKVSFANELARLSEALAQNVDDVVAAVGADSRIGPRFLRAGPGFGGSCFDKDVRALVARARELGVRFRTGESALATNDDQLRHVLRLVEREAGRLRGKTVTVLGLSFKAGTDDVRESRALPIVASLRAKRARVRVHDPVALANFRLAWVREGWGDVTDFAATRSVVSALRGSDLAVLQADWPEYRKWSPRWTAAMRTPKLLDLRRALSPSTARRVGLELRALGVGEPRGPMTPPTRRPSRRRKR